LPKEVRKEGDLCLVEERGCEAGVGNRSAKRQWRCVIAKERGGEGGFARAPRLVAIEVKLGGGTGSGLPCCSELLFNLFFKDGIYFLSPSFLSFSFF
jgi:hypothetical protein